MNVLCATPELGDLISYTGISIHYIFIIICSVKASRENWDDTKLDQELRRMCTAKKSAGHKKSMIEVAFLFIFCFVLQLFYQKMKMWIFSYKLFVIHFIAFNLMYMQSIIYTEYCISIAFATTLWFYWFRSPDCIVLYCTMYRVIEKEGQKLQGY